MKEPRFWFQTDLQAPRGKVIEIDVSKPARSNWKVVVPEAKNAAGDHFRQQQICSQLPEGRVHAGQDLRHRRQARE
jgi:hypothetical protein